MILTSLPDLPPAPQTLANAAFRQSFYARWGRENAVVCGHGRHAEYASIAQTLSIKMTLGGRERYFLPQRELVVDDDNLLVLNEGSRYGSLLQAERRPAWTFAIFFRPGMQDELTAQQQRTLLEALDSPLACQRSIEFAERLRPHRGPVSERLQRISRDIQAGERDEDWLETELTALLGLMLADERASTRSEPGRRPALQAELRRRLGLAADCIESHYPQPLNLPHLAEVACLSRYHFLREFTREFGLSPHDYLTRKRARAAQRLMAAGCVNKDSVAQQCGLGNRWTLQRALQRYPVS